MIEQILEADRHLQVDQVKQARDIYARVVELDPANAIAVVGLARCALADGDDEQAYELASQALRIDAQNDMARRMEARLSEILATRGDEVTRPDVAATPGPQEMRAVVTDDAVAGPAPARTTTTAAAGTATPAPTPTPAADSTATPALATAASSKPATSTRPTPSPRKERLMRKTLIDRLLGR